MSGNGGTLVATIDPTKPAGPNAQTADVRANFAATLAIATDHETRIETLESQAFMTPATPPQITGSRTDGTALASLLTALAGLGLVVDGSTP
jgi:hypothetical protein